MPEAIDYRNAEQQITNQSRLEVGKSLTLHILWTETATVDVQPKPDPVGENRNKKKHEYERYPEARASSSK